MIKVLSIFGTRPEAIKMAVKEKIRIRLKGYDHNLVDAAAEKIVETAR